MGRYRTVDEVAADLVALRDAAERARVALAYLFSPHGEFEASGIGLRRAGTSRSRCKGAWLRASVAKAALALVLLLI